MVRGFFFKQKTAYELRISDWSSDVCSSDLPGARGADAGDDVVHRGIKASADPALARRVALYAAVSESGSRTAELSVVLKLPARRSSFDEHDARVQDIRDERECNRSDRKSTRLNFSD